MLDPADIARSMNLIGGGRPRVAREVLNRTATVFVRSPGMHGNDPTPVKQLIHSLDRNDRYIVLLHYADGLTVQEVAQVLDLPAATVEATLERLRGKLLHAVHEAQAECDAPPAYRRSAAA